MSDSQILSIIINQLAAALLIALGAATGAIVTLYIIRREDRVKPKCESCLPEAKDRRARLPPLIILVRHGESEGNADQTLWRTKPDNLIELSERGPTQADEAGERVEEIFKKFDNDKSARSINRVHVIVSPFERTLQTASWMRPHFEHRIVRTDVEPRIREQEFGNMQGNEFDKFRKEQRTVGRFWYRFPTGESGADVYDRVKSWWFETVLNVNYRCGYEPVDALVVVSHGLTMRFVLMQLFHWSPTTFHSVWNAGNCDLYVLQKDLNKPGISPYVLEEDLGEMPKSSVDILVKYVSGRETMYKLKDYLSIPPPRTTRLDLVKEMLAKQYPALNKDDIVEITIAPFVKGGKSQGRTSSGVNEKKMINDVRRAKEEVSGRFPNIRSKKHELREPPKEKQGLDDLLNKLSLVNLFSK